MVHLRLCPSAHQRRQLPRRVQALILERRGGSDPCRSTRSPPSRTDTQLGATDADITAHKAWARPTGSAPDEGHRGHLIFATELATEQIRSILLFARTRE